MPRQGVRFPVNRCGNLIGRITASFSDSLATSSPATSSQRMFGLSTRIALVRPARSFFTSGSWSPSSSSFLLHGAYYAHSLCSNRDKLHKWHSLFALPTSPPVRHSVRPNRPSCAFITCLGQMVFELLG